jgi:tetratricopeptide (TPR) repeat protein
VALESLGRLQEAIAAYDDVVRRKPDMVEALSNRGSILSGFGRHEEALASFAAALRIDPGRASTHWNESLCRLRSGDYKTGWEKYEWRWLTTLQEKYRRTFSQPLWLGQAPLADQTILLHAEQGLGDTIQFCRYAEQLAARGATVLLEVQQELKALLGGLRGVSRVLGRGEPLPPFDWHCPLMSLPLACGAPYAPMPAALPYLAAPPEAIGKWEGIWQTAWAAPPTSGQMATGEPARIRRIGLAWAGNPMNKGDRHRSIPLARLGSLLTPGMRFVSLQKEVRESDRKALENLPQLLQATDGLRDFTDTAGLIATLDLVIAVDTSIAHLAGAMGKPVWILLPFLSDWRWLSERDDSPWYPCARLFRQTECGQWEGVIAQVAAALQGAG